MKLKLIISNISIRKRSIFSFLFFILSSTLYELKKKFYVLVLPFRGVSGVKNIKLFCCFLFCFFTSLVYSQEISEYKIKPVPIQNVKLTDEFWLPIVKRIQEKTIAYALKKCEEEGRMDNFLIAGGKMKGEVKGAMPFDDTDVYKIIEGASNTLLSAPNPKLEKLLDSLISIVAVGQETDGYLTTWRTINPVKPPAPWVKVVVGKRWESLGASHELYNAGHLFEAAAVHYHATGKNNFLDIAIKSADMLVRTFGDAEGQVKGVPGHQIVETGLIQLYKITGNKNYLNLSKYFLDNRGNANHHELYGAYSQDHKLPVEQDEVEGHAVRAVYMYAAMTDVAVMFNDVKYKNAVQNLWDNMVNKKMYITGGIGSKHEGEAFGANYELPNLTAYSETCAAIGNIYWNHRLHSMSGDVSYFDIIERTLYNSMISGISLDGVNFFYPNALEADGEYKFNRGACTRQGWFDCSCCPTNIIRFLPSMTNLIYSKSDEEVYVNLFVGSDVTINDKSGKLNITQTTSYPWYGKTTLKVVNNSTIKNIKVRIPHWYRGEVMKGNLYSYINSINDKLKVMINGVEASAEIKDGYIDIPISENISTTIEIDLPMKYNLVKSNPALVDNKFKAAIEYGPFVYAIESIDNPIKFENIMTANDNSLEPKWNKDLLGGVVTLENSYMKAIPYYAWSNRGITKMKVWIKNINW